MEYELPALRRDEKVALQLRALFEKQGYRLFRMGSFEEYDLYMQNKPFLMGEDIITFTAADGRLMALKPDVTLSIVKNTPPGEVRRVYYHENVFRRSHQSGEYREINQMGIEFIGGEGQKSEAEVLNLAARSLAALGHAALDLSHIKFIEAVLSLFSLEEHGAKAREALRDKSPHRMLEVAAEAGLAPEMAQVLAEIATLSGPFSSTLVQAQALSVHIPQAQQALEELQELYLQLQQMCGESEVEIRLDFSILNDVDYYNGLIFQGYASGIAQPVLAGGRYDNLLRRFEKPQGAVGFALYLSEVGKSLAEEQRNFAEEQPWLNIALPKGRLGAKVHALLQEASLTQAPLPQESRKLVFEDEVNRVRYFLVKPTDVDIYVEHGVADIGVVGRDVLLESRADVLELMDLGFGKCRLAVASKVGYTEDPARPLRVASKYPNVARGYYASQSRSVELIELHGSMELAPLIGLADVIVDIVETGTTLKENGLVVTANIAPSSARLISNRAAWRFKQERICELVAKLQAVL